MTDAGPASAGEPGLFDVVSTEVPFVGRIVSVRVDQVRMPGGEVAAREVVHHHRAVAVVALDDQDRVVMVGQYRHPLRRRLWELPAGLMDVAGELPQRAAARELAEEAGVAARDWRVLVDLLPSPGIIDERIRVFLATGLTAVDRSEITHEEADLVIRWVPLDTAIDAVMDGRIVNSPSVAGLLAARVALAEDRALRSGDDDWSTGPARIRTPDEPLGPPPAL